MKRVPGTAFWSALAICIAFSAFQARILSTGTAAAQDRTLNRDTPKHPGGEKRIALVIGNESYRKARALVNPVNDARAMARALREVGFEVLGPTGDGYVNLDQRGMIAAMKEFGRRLKANPGVGLFYFAGHGVEANDTNYLIPTDADPEDETDLKYQAVDIRDILEQFVGNRLNIVVLDACRDNPFQRGFRRERGGGDGLRQVDAPTGTLIAYATAPRRTASDGTGGNGLYTAQLLDAIRIPGLPIEQVFKRVRVQVQEKSRGAQIPWENSSLNGDFYFVPPTGATAVNPDPPPTATRERQFGTLVVTAAQPGTEIFIDGKSQGVAESKGEKFKVEKLTAGRTVEVRGRLKGRDPFVKQVEIEPNREVQVGVECVPPRVFVNAAGIECVFIPNGSFVMGSNLADEQRWTREVFAKYGTSARFGDQSPQHRVTLTRDFFIGRHEVTQRQWRYVAEKLPKVKRDLKPAPSAFTGDTLPVEMVNWHDCQEFILRLNALNDGFEYGLPTEAEWEYACRAGTTGDFAGNLDAMAWYANNSGNAVIDSYRAYYIDAKFDSFVLRDRILLPNGCRTHPVGQKLPNAFGLFDMHGNVYEWCLDFYSASFTAAPVTDPVHSSFTYYRVLHGGAWDSDAHFCRSAERYMLSPDDAFNYVGLRIVARPVKY